MPLIAKITESKRGETKRGRVIRVAIKALNGRYNNLWLSAHFTWDGYQGHAVDKPSLALSEAHQNSFPVSNQFEWRQSKQSIHIKLDQFVLPNLHPLLLSIQFSPFTRSSDSHNGTDWHSGHAFALYSHGLEWLFNRLLYITLSSVPISTHIRVLVFTKL